MAPSSSRTVKSDTGRVRHRHDTRFRDADAKKVSKELKRRAEAVKVLPPGLREEEDDEDWPPKYKKAPPPPKVQKVAARHPRTGRQQRDSTPSAPRPKVELRVSPERAVDLYDEGWRNTTEGDPAVYEKRMRMFYEQLKKDREFNRTKAIQKGLLSDPDKPTTLENAITIVGTCQEMCPVHERVERIVQQMVDKCEKVVHPATGEDVPYEDYMVKRFRRSAAGDDQQLPSDIRPPLVLQKTLIYLLEEIVAGPEQLSKVHKFVWDRTRAIRNDFSIQQVTKPDDVRVAIDCFERIARFHILALHQLSLPEHVENSDFDAHQELEQLSKTLLSLTYYYDDNRGTVTSSNEAEFRAYTTMLEIGYPRPRLEQRAKIWDKHVFEDQRVQMALSLYAMCGGIEVGEGPWFAGTPFEVARGNPRGFFPLLKSPKVPYLLACVAEISFYPIRGLILESIWNEFKDGVANSRTVKDWFVEDVRAILGFDQVDQATEFCLSHGLGMKITKGKKRILNFAKGHFQPEHRRNYPQVFSARIVENKRAFRTYLEIANGLWAPQEGIEEALDDLEASVRESYEPLFVSDDSDAGDMDSSSAQDASGATHQRSSPTAELTSTPNSSRGFTNSNSLPPTSSFGKPTPVPLPSSQNQSKSNKSQLSAKFGEPEHLSKPTSSTGSLAAGKERDPFGLADPVNPSNSPKIKNPFSAPPGKWQFPKDVIDNATKLASPAYPTKRISEVLSSQVPSENTTTQPVPFASESFFKNVSPNPFSQVPSGNTNAQSPFSNSNPFQSTSPNSFPKVSWTDSTAQSASPAPLDLSKSVKPNPFSQVPSGNTNAQSPFSNSNPFQTASRNPFPKVSWTDSNAQSASPAPLDSSKSVTPNPFSKVPSGNTNAQSPFSNSNPFQSASRNSFPKVSWTDSNVQSASPAPLDLSRSASPNPFSQVSWGGANAQPAPPAPLDSSKSVSPNPFSQVLRGGANAQPEPSAPLDLSKSVSPNPFSQVLWGGANAQPASPAPLDLSKSAILNPFSQASFGKPKAPESAPPQPLPFSNILQPSSGPVFKVSTANPSAWPAVSPFSGSFNLMFFNNPAGIASLPTMEQLLSYQESTIQARPQNSFLNSSVQSDQSAPQLDQLISQPDRSASQLDQPVVRLDQPIVRLNQPIVQLDQPIVQLDQSTVQLGQSTSQLDRLAFQPGTPTSQSDKSTFQSNTLTFQPDASTSQSDTSTIQPDTSTSQLDKSSFPPNKPTTLSDQISFPSDKSTSQSDRSTPQLDQSTSQFDKSAFQSVKASSQSDKSTLQSDESISQSDKSASRPDKFAPQPDQSAPQPDKSTSIIQDATWTFNKLEHPPNTIFRNMRKSFEQVQNERVQKKADEYRVMTLAKKYIKKWRTIAWKKGLMRRAPERRRRFAQSLQQMARDAALHQENLVASLLSRRSGNGDQQTESEPSTDSKVTHSTASKKRKSSDVEDDSIPDRMSRKKRSRLDQVQNGHMTPSRHIKSHHKRSRTEGNPKLSETEELINTLIATRDDYSYLANGSESSYKITQKIRTLLPPVKVDDTRTDYFMLKSLGIDPDTPIVPRTSRKRHSSDDILSTPIKRLKESPQTKSASALSPPSKRPRNRSPSPVRKSPQHYRDRSETTQSIDFDETENELLAVQRELNNKMTDVVNKYREQRAKWGSGRIRTSSVTPSRSIDYYKEQRAKWGTPTPSAVMKLRQSTSSKVGEILRAAPARYAGQAMGSKQDTKSAIRAEIEQRQRDSYATMQPGAMSDRKMAESYRLAATAVGGASAGSSAEAAIEL